MSPDNNDIGQQPEAGAWQNSNVNLPESPAAISPEVPVEILQGPIPQTPSQSTEIPQPPFVPNAHPSPALGPEITPIIGSAPPAPQPWQPNNQNNQPDPNKWQMGGISPQAAVYSGGSAGTGQQLPNKPRNNRKKFLLLGAASVLLLALLGGGYVFGYYLPNKPENVWKTGLDRSGKAFEKIVNDSTKKDNLDAFKKTQFNASIDIEAAQTNFAGTLDAQYDPTKANFNVTFSSKNGGEKEQKLSADVLSELAKGQKYPDSYFRLIGLKTLGVDYFVPGLEKYDGKWISVDGQYLKKLIGDQSPKSSTGPSSDEITELVRVAASTTSDYFLTSKPDKAVLKLNQFVAKEDSEGIKSYHYKAGIDKVHAKDYCQAIIEAVTSTAAYKKIPGYDEKTADKDKKNDIDDCKKSIDTDIKDSDTLDVWIDTKYKLLHKIRVTEGNKDQYFEIGQNYKGGDDIQLFVNYHDQESKADSKTTLDTNLKSSETKLTFNLTGGEGEDKYKINVTLTAKPLSGEVDVKKPSGAIPLEKVLKEFGLGDSSGNSDSVYGGVQSEAQDSERKTDIAIIESQLEAYWAGHTGVYPTTNQMNDVTWIKENLPGLSTDALKDPDGTTTVFAKTATATMYGYSPTGCSSSGCSGYVLTARLSTGELFTKKNLE